MSSDTDTRRVSARLPDDLHADLEILVDEGDVPSKSKVIREGIRREVDRRMGRDGNPNPDDVEAALSRIERTLDGLDDDMKRVIRGEFSRIESRDKSGRGR